MLYLGPYLGLYSILVTASSGGVYIYSCCSCYGCCRVAKAAIKVTSSTAIGVAGGIAIRVATSAAIRTTSSAVIKIASGIGGGSCGYYYGNSYRGSYKDC